MSTTKQRRGSGLGATSALSLVTQLIALGLALWATPALVRGLGDAAYAVVALMQVFASYFVWLELGLGTAYQRALAVALANRDFHKAQQLVETAHALFLRIALVGGLLLLAVGLAYFSQVDGTRAFLPHVVAGTITLVIGFSSSMALSAPRAIVFALQRTDLYFRLTILLSPLPILQVLAVRFGGGVLAVIALQVASNLAVDLALLWYGKQMWPEVVFRSQLHGPVWAELKGYSLRKFVGQLAVQGQQSADRLVLGGMLSAGAIAPYAVAASIATRLRVLGNALIIPFFPAATERFARDGLPGLTDITDVFGRRIATLVAIASAGAIFLARPFLLAWMGARFADEGSPAIAQLVLAAAGVTVAGIYSHALDAGGRPGAGSMGSVLGLVVAVGAAVPFVLRLGAPGAATGFLLGALTNLVWNVGSVGKLVGFGELGRLGSRGLLVPVLLGVGTWALMPMLHTELRSFSAITALEATGPALSLMVAAAAGGAAGALGLLVAVWLGQLPNPWPWKRGAAASS